MAKSATTDLADLSTGVTGKAAAAGLVVPGGGHGLTAADLAAAEANVRALLLEAVRLLAAPGATAGHLEALALLHAAVVGQQELSLVGNRLVPVAAVAVAYKPPAPYEALDAALAAAQAVLTPDSQETR